MQGMHIAALNPGAINATMLKLDEDQKARMGLKLAVKKQEHADLDAAIRMLEQFPGADTMLIKRLKKKKLTLKDQITDLEHYLTPDIIA